MEEQKLKFLIVNNYSQFASKDVWDGFLAVLRQDLGYEVMAYPINMITVFFSHDIIDHHIVSTAVSTRNNFTHVIFIGSTFVKNWVVSTIKKMGVKTIYWSMEDPHALDQNVRFLKINDEDPNEACVDYYFSNDRAVPKKFKNAFYLPTAGAHTVCTPPAVKLSEMDKESQAILDNDVVFCGNIYPNRREILEPLIPHFEKHKIKFGIMGITALMEDEEKESPLRKYIKGNFEGVVDHKIFIMAYGFSKFIINIERDPLYEYNTEYSSNRKHKVIGESLNPRAYEVALVGGGLQLIDNKRKEIFEKGILEPDKHCVIYDSPQDMIEKILYYMKHEDERLKIVQAARKHALENHTYLNRAKRMLNIINWKEDRKDSIVADAINRIFSGKKINTK